jgi:hypothetical protein
MSQIKSELVGLQKVAVIIIGIMVCITLLIIQSY